MSLRILVSMVLLPLSLTVFGQEKNAFLRLCEAKERNAILAARLSGQPEHVNCHEANTFLSKVKYFNHDCITWTEKGGKHNLCPQEKKFDSLDWIKDFDIRELSLMGNHIKSIQPLKGHNELTDLNLTHNEVTDLNELDVSHLNTVLLGENTPRFTNDELQHVLSLQQKLSIKSIDFSGSELSDFSFGSHVQISNEIDLSDTQVKDFSFFANQCFTSFVTLQHLHIKSLKDVVPKNGVPALWLDVDYNDLTNLEGFNLHQPREITAAFAFQANHNQLKALKGLRTDLYYSFLSFNHNELKNIDEFNNINCREVGSFLGIEVDVADNHIKDITPLKHLMVSAENQENDFSFFEFYNNPITYDQCMSQLQPEVRRADEWCSQLKGKKNAEAFKAKANTRRAKLKQTYRKLVNHTAH